jgi:outer membrane protein TolC
MASAINAYLDLLRAQGEIGVSDLAIGISTNYAAQLGQAAAIGLAFKGDLHRVELQTMRHQLARRQALERAGSSAARLAQSLRLNPATTLHGKTSELIPIPLNSTNALDRLIAQALASRPELKQSSAGSAAARYANKQVVYGPLAPTLTAQAFVGGLGGDAAGIPHRFGESEDYLVGLGWKLGPGGLLDRSRIRFTEARVRTAALTEEKIRDEVIREVVEAHGRVQSLEDQLATAQHAAETAERVVQLTRQRKQFGVGAVLEDIQAQQELAQARLELVNAITDYNKAQYGLRRAIGALGQ